MNLLFRGRSHTRPADTFFLLKGKDPNVAQMDTCTSSNGFFAVHNKLEMMTLRFV